MKRTAAAFLAATSIVLAACGGGSDSPGTPTQESKVPNIVGTYTSVRFLTFVVDGVPSGTCPGRLVVDEQHPSQVSILEEWTGRIVLEPGDVCTGRTVEIDPAYVGTDGEVTFGYGTQQEHFEELAEDLGCAVVGTSQRYTGEIRDNRLEASDAVAFDCPDTGLVSVRFDLFGLRF